VRQQENIELGLRLVMVSSTLAMIPFVFALSMVVLPAEFYINGVSRSFVSTNFDGTYLIYHFNCLKSFDNYYAILSHQPFVV
jgi:hypothetical protein